MRTVFIDFESFWSVTHSLTKMNPAVYVMHPETEIQSVAVKVGKKGKTRMLWGESQIQQWCDSVDWSDVMVVGHNMSEFDAMILAWRFGVKPKMWGCTLAMARPLYAKVTRLSLGALAKYLGIEEEKLSLEETNTKGKKLADFSPEERVAMKVYNIRDTELCAQIFGKLIGKTPAREMKLIDMTIRMITEPKFEADILLLKKTLARVLREKEEVLGNLAYLFLDETKHFKDQVKARAVAKMKMPAVEDRAELARSELSSAKKFSDFLTHKGVPIPLKESPSNPDKLIPALAKTDEAMAALQEHDDFEVAAAAAARLQVRSTILETRLQHFIDIAESCNGMIPAPLRYYGADTTGRWSGIFKINMQNLPRVNPHEEKPSDALRKSLRAPDGWKVVVADLSGIELRVNMTLWQVPYAMKMFAKDPEADLYKPLASEVLNVPMKGMPKMVRQAGKAMHLGCGFGLGSADKYITVAKSMAQIDVTKNEAFDHIQGYRQKHPEIVNGWKTCHRALTHIAQGVYGVELDPAGLCVTSLGGIKTPRGMIRYPALHKEESEFEEGRFEWIYGTVKSKRSRIYAGKVDENIVQNLAREVLADMALDVAKTPMGRLYPLAHTVHDELIYVVREEHAQEMLDTVQAIMREGVWWWPELVTWSEGDIAQTYGDAK